MHLLAFVAWAAVWSTLPVRLIAVSATVYGVTQLLKQFVPKLGGRWAIALNVVLSVTGVLSVAQPGQLSDPAFWSSLLTTAAAAAGIHGTVKSLLGGKPAVS